MVPARPAATRDTTYVDRCAVRPPTPQAAVRRARCAPCQHPGRRPASTKHAACSATRVTTCVDRSAMPTRTPYTAEQPAWTARIRTWALGRQPASRARVAFPAPRAITNAEATASATTTFSTVVAQLPVLNVPPEARTNSESALRAQRARSSARTGIWNAVVLVSPKMGWR